MSDQKYVDNLISKYLFPQEEGHTIETTPDDSEVALRHSGKTTSITLDMKSPSMRDGEETLWVYRGLEGVFHKTAKYVEVITNYRVFKYDYKNGKMLEYIRLAEVDDVITTNKSVSSKIQHTGYFVASGRNTFGGIATGTSNSKTVTYGNVVFMRGGSPSITLYGVSDPDGIQQLVSSVIKTLYPKYELRESPSQNTYGEIHPRTLAEDPIVTLKLRYARGEITKEQFDQMKRDLEA